MEQGKGLALFGPFAGRFVCTCPRTGRDERSLCSAEPAQCRPISHPFDRNCCLRWRDWGRRPDRARLHGLTHGDDPDRCGRWRAFALLLLRGHSLDCGAACYGCSFVGGHGLLAGLACDGPVNVYAHHGGSRL